MSNTLSGQRCLNVEAISGGKFNVPHFTGKAKIDRIVKEAGFANHTFVIAPFYYQNLVGALLRKSRQTDPWAGLFLSIPSVRCIHMGDIRELGNIVAGAFAHPDEAGNGEYLPLVGDFMSFNEIVETLNRQGHNFSLQAGPNGRLRDSLPWGRRDCRDVQLLRSSYLSGFGFVRSNRARKQNCRQATDQVFDVGASELFGAGRLVSGLRSVGALGLWVVRREASRRDDDVSTCTLGRRVGSC